MLEQVLATILDVASKGATSILVDALRRENDGLVKKNKATNKEARIEARVSIATPLVSDSLIRHVESIRRWCATVQFVDLRGQKYVSSIFVELDAYLTPLSTHATPLERGNTRPLFEVLHMDAGHAVILGGPGAGKTTSLQKICVDYFKKGKALLNYNFPILVRLREIKDKNSKLPLFEKLLEILPLKIEFPSHYDLNGKEFDSISRTILRATVAGYIDKLQVLVLIDGFDEIGDQSLRDIVANEITILQDALASSRIILTSRSKEFRYRFNAFARFELAPLTKEQILQFAQRWLGDEGAAQDFCLKVLSSPFADAAIRPLTVAHLCAIYERIKTIPDKPKSVYKRVVHLLLEEWDSQRDIARNSKYAGFDSDRKVEFLAHFAFILTIHGKFIFDSRDLEEIYSQIHRYYNLPASDCDEVVGEIESHSGLMLEGGYRAYEFAHKSIQEYLAADYLVRLPTPEMVKERIALMPNECAIATALSSRPSLYLRELILKAVPQGRGGRDWRGVFLARLALEKPELECNQTGEDALAASILLMCDGPDQYFSLLRPMVSQSGMGFVKDYYSLRKEDAKYYYLTRRRMHREYVLPPGLVLHRAFVSEQIF